MISFSVSGDWAKTDKFLKAIRNQQLVQKLNEYGNEGVRALSSATPKDSGKTASSWDYRIEQKAGTYSIIWTNSNVNNGVNIAIILQYGHGTRNGGYVQGRDYINPAIKPVMDKIAEAVWKEVTSL